MKKTLSIVLRLILVVALIFSVTACKPKPTAVVSTSGSESEDTSPFTLELYTQDNAAMMTAYEQLSAKYNMQFPHLTVNYNTVPGSEYQVKIPILFATEQPVDLINVLESAIGGLVQKLATAPDYVVEDIKTNLPDSYKFGQIDGKVYGYMYPVSLFAYVNVKMFEEAGLDYPTTYDEVIEVNEAMTKTITVDGAQVLKRGANLWYASGVPTFTTSYWNSLYVALGGSVLTEDGAVDIDNALGIEACELLKTLSNRDGNFLTDFAAGNVGWMFGATWMTKYLRNNGVEGLEFEVIQVPVGSAGEPIAQGFFQMMVVPSWSPERNQKEAWKFSFWSHNNENNYLLETVGGVGDWRLDTIERLGSEDPATKGAYDSAKYAVSPFIHPKFLEIQRIICDWVEKYIYDNCTAAEAMANAQAEIDAIVE